MGFFDSYSDEGGGGLFLSKDEKQILIDEGVPFDIVAIDIEDDKKFEQKKRYVLTIDLEGETRKLGFGRGSVFSRDRLLDAMIQHFADGGASVTTRIEMEGRAQILVDGS